VALPGFPGKTYRSYEFFFVSCGLLQLFQSIMSWVQHSVKNSLLSAFRYLLKPLVRMAIKNGVSFPEFSNALKQAYVDVASRQIKSAGMSVSSEGIFVITSIETKEVDKVLRADTEPHVELDAQAQSPLPRLLNAWHVDFQYTGPYGVLRDLEFTRSTASEGKSFSDLAATYCPGISPRALLDELIRTECVKEVGAGVYRALGRSYVPDPLSDESIRLVAQVVHNLCETLEVNLRPESRGGKGLVQRTVYTRTGLSPEALKRLESHVRDRGQLFAEQIDDWFTNNQEREGSQGRFKTGIGIYHYVVNDEDELEFSKELPIAEGEGK
jgi:hypothetical protein